MFPGNKLDRSMWCPDCRQVVIRRATLVGQGVGLLTALLLALWIFSMVGTAPRFLMAYVVMVVAAYFFLFKLTQRVAFELIRARGVPPPEVEENG
jgi:hypothetical protein